MVFDRFRCWSIALILLLAIRSAPAQEALQNAQAGQNASAAQAKQLQSSDYTFKDGDFRVLVLPSMGLQWNDNINLSQTNVMDDYILSPSVGVTASYPLTQRNVLFLNITAGYQRYLDHPNLSTFDLNSSSGTGLSFEMGIKDVTLNFHDWMNYTKDGAGNGTVANTADYGTFQNTAGLLATWDLNQVSLSLGYDHQNVLATSAQFDSNNRSSEMIFAQAGFQIHPKVTVGLEASTSFTAYQQSVFNNNDSYTIGAYTTFRPSAYFSVSLHGGLSTYQFQDTSTTNIQTGTRIQTSSVNSWYGDVSISHQVRESISYSLDAGHDLQLGTQSALVEDWHVGPNITWSIIRDLSFSTGLFYTHGDQGVGSTGNASGTASGSYDWYGGSLSLGHPLTSWLVLGLTYRLTFRSSSTPNDGYTQNLVGLQLTYHPK
jgi:hypothetical protein